MQCQVTLHKAVEWNYVSSYHVPVLFSTNFRTHCKEAKNSGATCIGLYSLPDSFWLANLHLHRILLTPGRLDFMILISHRLALTHSLHGLYGLKSLSTDPGARVLSLCRHTKVHLNHLKPITEEFINLIFIWFLYCAFLCWFLSCLKLICASCCNKHVF